MKDGTLVNMNPVKRKRENEYEDNITDIEDDENSSFNTDIELLNDFEGESLWAKA